MIAPALIQYNQIIYAKIKNKYAAPKITQARKNYLSLTEQRRQHCEQNETKSHKTFFRVLLV